MGFPTKLKNFNLFADGNNYMGEVLEIKLPLLARKMAEHRGAGMDSAIEVDMGGEVMKAEWIAAGLLDGLFDSFGASKIDAAMLRFMGAYVNDATGETVAVEVVMRGRHTTIDLGTAKAGEDNTIPVTTSLVYYKLIIDGEDIIEKDELGKVFKVRGIDRNEGMRKALGL